MKLFRLPAQKNFLLLLAVSACLLFTGCTTTKVTPEMSEQMRQMAEMRDTCTQYAAWVARDFKSDSPEFKRAQQLYIEASASANSYIEALQFDVAMGAKVSEEKYAAAAQRVHDSSRAFLDYSRDAVGIPKTRGLPLLIPLAAGLVDLGMKLNSAVKSSNASNVNWFPNPLPTKSGSRSMN